jgi:cell division protein FtsI (penicillin-binding protein 3)
MAKRSITKKQKNSNYNWRYMMVMIGLVVLAGSLSARVTYLQVVEKEFLGQQADARSLRSEKIPAHRGMIKDRNGRALAISTPVVSLWMNPKQIIKNEAQWGELAKTLGMKFSDLEDRILNNQNKGFIYLTRHISPSKAEKVLALDVNGVYSEAEYRRFYPAGEVAAHVVGLTNIDDKGIEGIELNFEEKLKGSSGKKKVIKDRRGGVIKDIEIMQYADAGEDVSLSIDLRAQYLAYKELSYAFEKFDAQSGSAIAIDVESGEILALVNKPSFNPNSRRNVKANSLRNRGVTDLFEPGSTVKPFTVLSALQSGKYTVQSQLDTRPGFIKVGRKTIRDHQNYGVIDMTTVLTKSSNVGTTKLALSLPHGELHKMMEKIGFGEQVSSGLPGESRGVVPMPHKGRPIEVAAMSYGYGLSVTALQLANAYTILANDGIEVPLSILHKETTVVGRRVLDSGKSKEIVAMMETVVSEQGTASRASIQGYSVAGKTGTVHRVVNGVYADDQYTSLFAGMAPASNPKVVLVVVVNNPKGDDYYGGLVAAPVFSKIMEGILRVRDIAPDKMDDFPDADQVAGLI